VVKDPFSCIKGGLQSGFMDQDRHMDLANTLKPRRTPYTTSVYFCRRLCLVSDWKNLIILFFITFYYYYYFYCSSSSQNTHCVCCVCRSTQAYSI